MGNLDFNKMMRNHYSLAHYKTMVTESNPLNTNNAKKDNKKTSDKRTIKLNKNLICQTKELTKDLLKHRKIFGLQQNRVEVSRKFRQKKESDSINNSKPELKKNATIIANKNNKKLYKEIHVRASTVDPSKFKRRREKNIS